jgi:hypothetical protein
MNLPSGKTPPVDNGTRFGGVITPKDAGRSGIPPLKVRGRSNITAVTFGNMSLSLKAGSFAISAPGYLPLPPRSR